MLPNKILCLVSFAILMSSACTSPEKESTLENNSNKIKVPIRNLNQDFKDYWFSGKLLVTRTVSESLPPHEIHAIVDDVRAFVKSNQGIDYLQVYENNEGDKLFFIDQLSKRMIATGEFAKEDNHATLLYSYEY